MNGTSERPLRVLVLARQSMLRAALRGLLSGRLDIETAGEAASAGEAGNYLESGEADAILCGWDSSNSEEVATLERLAAPGIPIVLIGDLPNPRELQAALRAGVRGILLADAGADDISTALHSAYQGLLVLDPALARALATVAHSSGLVEEEIVETLTDRERDVLELIAQGLPNKSIAHRLNISEHTVKFHVGSVMAKLGATSRTEAVTRAVRQGLLAL